MLKRFVLRDLVDDRPQDGVFRVNRALFRDPALFALEMKHVFEGGRWAAFSPPGWRNGVCASR